MNNYKNMDTSQLQDTDTNLHPNLLAASPKLVSEHRRREYHSSDYNNHHDDNELDDNYGNYTNNSSHHNTQTQNSYTHNTQTEENHTATENNTNTYDGGSGSREEENKKPVNPDENLTQEELMLRKLDMLRKLSELAQAGVKLSQNYNMNSDYKMMKYEYELHKGIRAKQNGINWMSSMTLNMIYGIEMLNEKYNPFDLKLKNWSEQVNADINNYYDVFGELYEKYNQPGKNMAPELKLLFMVSGSALKFHLTNQMASTLPTLNEQMGADPELAEQLRQKAVSEKIKEQTIKNNQALNNMMDKEHQAAAQRAQDLNEIRRREMEFLQLQRDNAKKQNELDELRNKLKLNQNQSQQNNTDHVTQMNTQINGATSVPQPSKIMRNNNSNNTNNTNNAQPTMNVPPLVQRMMAQRQAQMNPPPVQNSLPPELIQQQMQLLENQRIQMENEMKKKYIEELERIKNLRQEEEQKANNYMSGVKIISSAPINQQEIQRQTGTPKSQKSNKSGKSHRSGIDLREVSEETEESTSKSSKSSKKTSSLSSTEDSTEVSSKETSDSSAEKSSKSSSSLPSEMSSSGSSKSSVNFNVNLQNMLKTSKKSYDDQIDKLNSSDKIKNMGLVDQDEISKSNISLGVKNKKNQKPVATLGRAPKQQRAVKTRKTNINM